MSHSTRLNQGDLEFIQSAHTVTGPRISFRNCLLHMALHKIMLPYAGRILVCKETTDQRGHKFTKIGCPYLPKTE